MTNTLVFIGPCQLIKSTSEIGVAVMKSGRLIPIVVGKLPLLATSFERTSGCDAALVIAAGVEAPPHVFMLHPIQKISRWLKREYTVFTYRTTRKNLTKRNLTNLKPIRLSGQPSRLVSKSQKGCCIYFTILVSAGLHVAMVQNLPGAVSGRLVAFRGPVALSAVPWQIEHAEEFNK